MIRKITFLILFGLGVGGFGGQAAAEAPLYAGSAKEDITPEAGTPLSGYGKLRGKKTAGTHDPVFARALAVSRADDDTYLFLSLDLCLVDKNLRRAILKKINAYYPLKEARFVVFATHTHSGPGAVGKKFWQRFIMGPFDKEVFETLTGRAAKAAVRALEGQVPVRAEYGETRIDDVIENRMIPSLRYPQHLKIFRFRDGAGEIRAMLVSMAAHPTLFPAKELLFSADYPGLFMDQLEHDHPKATAVFANGAAGDLRPHARKGDDKKERMQNYAAGLAEKAAGLVYREIPLEGPWKAVLAETDLPPVKVRAGPVTVPSWIGNRFFPGRTYFHAVRLGPFLFMTFPGELSSETGHEIEARIRERGLNPVLIGFAHDYIGYVIPSRYYPRREEYEARVSFYGRHMDSFVYKKTAALADSVLTPDEISKANPPGRLEYREGLPVLFLQGDGYHRGYEEGRLLKEEIQTGTGHILRYFRKELKVPLVNRLIIRTIGNRAWKQMAPYLSYEEHRLIQGLADGAGVSPGTMRRLHAIPELFPTLCANGAYWGKATADGRLIAIRNLDWNRGMKVHDLAAIKYVSQNGGPDYVNIGYAGFGGVLSGVNEQGISVGQIGAKSADQTLRGTPMPFLLKRILKESRSLEDAASVFKRSELTNGYNYLIADASARDALVVEATASHIAFFKDGDAAEKEVDYALPVENALFRGDPALDPVIRDLQWASKGNPKKPGLEPPGGSAYEVRYLKQGRLVLEHYGKITPETAKVIAREIAPPSNIQSVVYAFPDFWAANAAGDLRAVDAGFRRFNFEKLKAAAESYL